MPRASGPLWDGAPLAGRRLLLRAEQGLGDTIQFARYARAAARSGPVALECPAALARLLSQSGLCEAVVARGEDVAFDVEAALMSAPFLLDPGLECAGGMVPYLSAEPDRVCRWARRLDAARGLKVGVCWQGNPAYRADRVRSIPLARFLPLAGIPGVTLVSLQKGPGADQLAGLPSDSGIMDFGAALDEGSDAFVDTAAVMANLDLVVTSDTAAAHLAGALGIETWLALAFAPDWRWGRAGETTPWYPAMRLFRQGAPGDWDGVFAKIARELAARAGKARGGKS